MKILLHIVIRVVGIFLLTKCLLLLLYDESANLPFSGSGAILALLSANVISLICLMTEAIFLHRKRFIGKRNANFILAGALWLILFISIGLITKNK